MEIFGLSAAVASIVWAFLWARVRMHQHAASSESREQRAKLDAWGKHFSEHFDTWERRIAKLDDQIGEIVQRPVSNGIDLDRRVSELLLVAHGKLEARLKQADLVPELAREFSTLKSAIALKQSFGK
jgi:hypothetical protein